MACMEHSTARTFSASVAETFEFRCAFELCASVLFSQGLLSGLNNPIEPETLHAESVINATSRRSSLSLF